MRTLGKGEQEDLAAEQKKILKALAGQYKRDAIRLTGREETP